MEEPAATPPIEPEPAPSKLERTAAVAAALLRHKELLVAAMEALRDKQVLTEEQQVKVMTAYEQGNAVARSAIHDLLERLQQANLGKVVVELSQAAPDLSPQHIRSVAQPYFSAAKESLSAEARPYIERARARLAELKALEEPTLRRLEAVSANFRDAGREVAQGLKGVGREAADELVKRGKRWWMSAETEELEREFFDWALKNMPRAEQAIVRILIGLGSLLLISAVLVSAREFGYLEHVAVFAGIFLLVFLGLVFLNWGFRLGEAIRDHRGEIERLARMPPAERRVYLIQRWAKRAQEEGVITSNEAQTVIMQTIRAVPEDAPPASEPAP